MLDKATVLPPGPDQEHCPALRPWASPPTPATAGRSAPQRPRSEGRQLASHSRPRGAAPAPGWPRDMGIHATEGRVRGRTPPPWHLGHTSSLGQSPLPGFTLRPSLCPRVTLPSSRHTSGFASGSASREPGASQVRASASNRVGSLYGPWSASQVTRTLCAQ